LEIRFLKRTPHHKMEGPNLSEIGSTSTVRNEIQFPSGLKLPQRQKQNDKIIKPASPKDTTAIIVNGNPVSREDLTPIVDQQITLSESKIDLLENPSAIHDILEQGLPQKPVILTQIPKDSPSKSSTPQPARKLVEDLDEPFSVGTNTFGDTRITTFQNQIPDIVDTKPYKKFNPPFPNQTPSIKAYVESVESTDTSAIGPNIQPKITSPTDAFSIDVKSPSIIVDTRRDQERRDQERREQERRDQERREQERREQERREQERRDQERRDQERKELERREQEKREQEKREQERREQERREQERREQERREQERREQEKKNSKPSTTDEEKPLTREELMSRAQDCFLKYQILQKSWQEYKFPNMDEKLVQSNPQIVIDTYRISVERIQIDMDVNQYKIALIIMFLVIEVVCVKVLGLNAGGYTLSQIKAMNRYEKLLIEIGEKKMMIGGDSWPPEVRILFIGLFNCGLFILMKYLSSVLGPELVGYISPIVNGLFSGALDNSKTANLPDEIPQKQQDLSGMLGGVASMAANALSGNQTVSSSNLQQPRASRRPVYRE
jgi:hypothetical protein